MGKDAKIPGTATNPSACTAFVRMSASCVTMSLSKNRPKKCRTSSRNAPMSGLPDDCGNLPRRRPDVLLTRELPENLLEIRQVHQLPQPPDLVIGDDPALV